MCCENCLGVFCCATPKYARSVILLFDYLFDCFSPPCVRNSPNLKNNDTTKAKPIAGGAMASLLVFAVVTMAAAAEARGTGACHQLKKTACINESKGKGQCYWNSWCVRVKVRVRARVRVRFKVRNGRCYWNNWCVQRFSVHLSNQSNL